MRVAMQFERELREGSALDGDTGLQQHVDEAARAVCVHLHDALRAILVGRHDDAGYGTEMQIPELVAGREGRQEEVFRVPACRVAAKGRIGGRENVRFAVSRYDVVAAVITVARGPRSGISLPRDGHPVFMPLFAHRRCPSS